MHAFVDYRITHEELKNLEKLNINPIIVPKTSTVYKAIDGHPDIQLNILKNNSSHKVIVHKDICSDFKENLNSNHIEYIVSKNSLSYTYPEDIILNAVVLDNYFIHTLKYTDENLLKSQEGKTLINIPQGYSKCSVLPVRENALITSDKGIVNSLKDYDFDILLIPPSDILLPSLNYGFIGGTGGIISQDRMAFFGELEHYRYGEEVKNFLYKYDVEPVPLRKGKLIDRGSLLVI